MHNVMLSARRGCQFRRHRDPERMLRNKTRDPFNMRPKPFELVGEDIVRRFFDRELFKCALERATQPIERQFALRKNLFSRLKIAKGVKYDAANIDGVGGTFK